VAVTPTILVAAIAGLFMVVALKKKRPAMDYA